MLPFFAGQAVASAAVLVIASVVCVAMRRNSAAQRHYVWLLAFATLLVLPACAWLIAPYLPRLARSSPTPVVTVTVGSAEVSVQPPSPSERSHPFAWTTLMLAAWGLGTSLLLVRTGAGLLICARRRRRATAFPDAATIAKAVMSQLELRTPTQVLAAPDVSMPETFGLFKPAVLLPVAACEWPAERLRVVLLHELVHVKRGDWTVQLLARIAAAVFWFNPLAWYGLARLQDERELACDDEVLRLGVGQSQYAQELLEIARSSRAESPELAVAMARTAHLEDRIHAILNPEVNRRSLTVKTKLLSAVPAVLVIATASLVTAPAQIGNSSVSGTVRDPSGAVVPDVRVIMSDGKGQEIARTNEVGRYVFSGVPAGKYSLTVQHPGFRAFNKSDIAVGAGSASELDVMLDIGRLSEHLEVTALGQARPQNQTHLSSYSYSVDRKDAKPAQPATAQSTPVPSERAPGTGPTRIRVGGNIRPAKVLKHVRPVYPLHLIGNGVEGTVLLQAVVGTNGEMLSVETRNSQVDPDLIKAAMDAVKQWRYEPTLLNGQPVEVVTSLTVEFRLKP